MKHHWLKMSLSIITGLAVTLFFVGCEKKDTTAEKTEAAKEMAPAQTLCPIMGEKIDKSLYVDADGYRIYVCCKACVTQVEKDPQAAIAKIKENGEMPEKLPAICPKCGEYKGSDKCCKAGIEICPKCGMHAGSPGCCQSKQADKEPMKEKTDMSEESEEMPEELEGSNTPPAE